MPNQRDVVEVNFLLPNGKSLNHPVIVISNDEINKFEDGFTGVMMTSSLEYKGDDYSFEVESSMFTKPLITETNFCVVRVHLISTFPNSHIIPNSHNNQMKIDPFDRLIAEINERTFGFTFKD